MATISNTPRPGYVWDSTDNVWYPIGVGGHSHGEIPATIVDAKGDLIVATAADTVSRLAVGNSGETIVANSAASTGLAWAGNYSAGKNKLINGDFQVWQRGTSFASPSGTYTADRWLVAISGGSAGTASQQTFSPGTAPVAGYEGTYYLRMASAAGATYLELAQRVEDVRAFAGQTVNLSFWAKATSSITFTPLLRQNFGSGGSANVDTGGSTQAIASSSWTRYTVSVAIPSVSGKTIGTSSYLGVILYSSAGTTASNTVEFWGVQLEAGSVATAFQTATGTLQGELAACQRYYVRLGGAHLYESMGGGAFESSTVGVLLFPCPVTLRIAATSVEFSSIYAWDYGAARTITNVAINNSGKNVVNLLLTLTGGTQYRPLRVETNNSLSGYIAVSAEL